MGYAEDQIPGWPQWSTTEDSATYYYTGARLSGSFDEIANKCAQACHALGYVQAGGRLEFGWGLLPRRWGLWHSYAGVDALLPMADASAYDTQSEDLEMIIVMGWGVRM